MVSLVATQQRWKCVFHTENMLPVTSLMYTFSMKYTCCVHSHCFTVALSVVEEVQLHVLMQSFRKETTLIIPRGALVDNQYSVRKYIIIVTRSHSFTLLVL